MPETTAHPSQEQLSAYNLGQLPPDEAVAIESHISECEPCCDTIVSLSSDDTFVGLLKEARQLPTDQTVDHGVAAASSLLKDVPTQLAEHPRYEILGLIGKGGMGDVYKARHRMMERTVALKIIKREFVRKPEAVDRFHREVKTAAQLSHPNIVTAYDAEQAGDVHYLVMEYVDGVDLSHIIKDRGALPIAEACEYVRQAAIGLQYAHEQGMIHRDIKPHNLMLTVDGTVKVLDFGLASLAPDAVSDADTVEARGDLTAAGSIMGTPDFISPEQADDARQADIRSDIYSLGATLYFLLSGQPPFSEGSVMHKLKSHAQAEPKSLDSLRDDIPADLAAVISRMMAKDPGERFQTPAAVAEALAPFSRASQRAEEQSAQPQVQPRRQRSRFLPLTAIATLFVAAIVAAVIYYIQTNNGVVRVEVTDPSLKVAISDQTITMNEGNKKPLTIRAGEQSLVVRQGDSDFEFETDRFQIRRGDRIAFKVELLPGEVVVSKDGEKIGAKALATKPDISLRGLGGNENTKDELRKILERSPHLREKLAQEAEESGNLELAKWIRSDLPVDDGQDSLALANSLAEKDDWAAATDAYLSAYRSDPNLYVGRHVQAFQKAGRLTELARFFDETRLQKLDPFNNGMESLIWALLREEETQPAGYELLKRVFKYHFHTADLLLRSSVFRWEKVPDPVFYLRCVLLPTDFEQPGWAGLSVGSSNDNRVSVYGFLTIARPLYHDRETLRQFATEIRELVEKHPKWVGGWALLAFIEAEGGNTRAAVDVLRKRFLEADSDEIPPSAAWLLGECLQGKDEELDRVVIELLEPVVRKIATLTYKRTPGTSGPIDPKSLRLSPIKTLARLYATNDRRQEARQLLYGLTDSVNQHPLVEGYEGNTIERCGNGQRCLACHRVDRGSSNFQSYYDVTEMSDAMTEIGYPVDSLIALARMDQSYGNAFDSAKGWLNNSPEWVGYLMFPIEYDYFDKQQSKAERAVTPGAVVEALELDTFQRSSRIEGKVELELMLSVRGEGPDAQATVFSPVIDILKLAVEFKGTDAAKDIAELDKRLVTLSEKHPKSIEAGIVATVFAFLRNDLDSAKDRLKRLQAITDYPESDGAAFWLVARHALQHDQTRIIGAVLAERALAAASAQPDSRLKDAIVRERSGVGLRKLLKRDPQLREKLAQEAEESDNSELAEWIRSDLPVDDGQDSLALPTRLAENEDWDAACDAYLAAYEANPDLFDFGHHLKAFREAGRVIELAQCFDEKKLRKMKEPAMFGDPDLADMMLNLAGELIRNTKTRLNGYELLKRVMKSQRRARDRVFRYHNFRWEDVPEPAYYLRTLFIPEDFTSEGDGWWRLSVGALPDHFGTPNGLLKDTEPLYRDRIALGKLAGEIRVLADENPTWAAGWALLAFIESKAGNHREAVRVLRERFVDSDIEKMPCHAAWMIGICLAGQNSDLDKVVIQLLEYSLRKLITGDFKRPVRLYRTSSGKVSMPQYGPLPGAPLRRWPIKELARLYAEHGRRLEARQLLYGLVDPIDQHPLVEGYFPGTYNGGCGNRGSCIACHRGEKIFFDFVAKTDAMTDVGYPVDSLLSLARIDASFRNAFSSSRGWIDSSTEEGKRFNETDLSGKYQALYYFNEQQAKARKALTPRMVIEALELDTFQRSARIYDDRLSTALELMKSFEGDDEKTKALRELARTSQGRENKGKVVLDLMLSVRGEGKKAEATVFSPVVDILKLVAESKQSGDAKDIAELDKRLVTLSEQHPKSIEAGIVATVFAFLRNDLDSAKDRLKRLQAITDYPESDGAAFWLAARHALQHDQTRIIGAVLAERALTAAETQPDSGLKEAILHEQSGIRTK